MPPDDGRDSAFRRADDERDSAFRRADDERDSRLRRPDDESATPLSPDRPHRASLRFDYLDERRARIVARSVGVEVGEIDADRSGATVERDGDAVVVRVAAADLVALRAGLNTWTRLVSVAERAIDAASAADA